MKETSKSGITVTSSSNEIKRINWKKVWWWWGEGVTPPPPPPFVQQASGQIFKDDVNSFLSTSDAVFAS
jgi:hypothetical protein